MKKGNRNYKTFGQTQNSIHNLFYVNDKPNISVEDKTFSQSWISNTSFTIRPIKQIRSGWSGRIWKWLRSALCNCWHISHLEYSARCHTHTYLYIFILVYCALKLRIYRMGWDGAGKKRKHTQVWQLCNKNRRRFIARAWFRVEESRSHFNMGNYERERGKRGKKHMTRICQRGLSCLPAPPAVSKTA